MKGGFPNALWNVRIGLSLRPLHRVMSSGINKKYIYKICIIYYIYIYKGKVKAVQLQARKVPEGSRKIRFPDIVTTPQDGGKVVSLTHRPSLHPENIPGTHFC